MIQLEFKDYPIAKPLLTRLQHYLVLKTLLAGTTRGHIYIDKPTAPNLAFAQFRHRAFISGDPNANLQDNLHDFILTQVFENCRQSSVPLFRLTTSDPVWLKIINECLADRDPIIMPYRFYQYEIGESPVTEEIPNGFEIRIVNHSLLKETFEGKENLLEEMCSERESVNTFLENSFGVCAFHEKTIAGWCLSEYNCQDQCEVGIATMPPFQHKGLATGMSQSFINLAHSQGINTIFWHCYASNIGSWRTALRVGFKMLSEKDVLILYLDKSLNQAVHGNRAL